MPENIDHGASIWRSRNIIKRQNNRISESMKFYRELIFGNKHKNEH